MGLREDYEDANYKAEKKSNVGHTRTRGERNGRAILKEEQVREIYKSQNTLPALAVIYGVCLSAIQSIKNGSTWSDTTKGCVRGYSGQTTSGRRMSRKLYR